MKLSPDLAEAIIVHAREEFPNECCGLVAGRDGVATRVLPAINTEGTPFMYVMDPREQMDLMEHIEDSGEDLLAIYHSHTRSAAYPSKTDVELAFFAEPLYVIVSLQDENTPVIRAFHLERSAAEGEQITEEPVDIS
ncbi:MAG: M67 family metallopeptidase [Thermoleophilia bacterium]|nr:M67 family metallopeptidase [Thermoleophilia bacterium]